MTTTDLSTQEVQAPITQMESEEAQRYYSASQFQLIWWRFRKHRLARTGALILLTMALVGLFAEFVGPYSGITRVSEAVLVAPQAPQFCNDDGCSLRPFLPGITSERNTETLRMETKIDPSVRRDIYFFVEGEEYKLLGMFKMNTHLFGVEEGSIHLLGTDSLGRDIFSRTLLATRTSLSIGIIGVIIAFVLALVIGGVAGYFGGGLDYAIQRLTEIVRVIPVIPLYMGLAAAFPKEWSSTQVYFAMTLVLALVGWPTLARRIRGKLLSLRGEDYVIAASLAGAGPSRIIGRHLLPAFMSYIIVDLVISFPFMLLSETALSFVGLGLRPPTVSWGVLLQDAQTVRAIEQAPWLFIPALFVIVAVLSFTVLGDGLRDAADPYQVSG
ncbi:MAG: ABC transporter permease [Anaerolineales bacterium]|nr:ABC transporter permease [Anaerolineales bacterium]